MENIRVRIKARKENTMFFATAMVGQHTFPDMLVYRPSDRNADYHLLSREERTQDGDPTGKTVFQITDGKYPANYRMQSMRGKTIYRPMFKVPTAEAVEIQKCVVSEMAKTLSGQAPTSEDVPDDTTVEPIPESTANGTPEGDAFDPPQEKPKAKKA